MQTAGIWLGELLSFIKFICENNLGFADLQFCKCIMGSETMFNNSVDSFNNVDKLVELSDLNGSDMEENTL